MPAVEPFRQSKKINGHNGLIYQLTLINLSIGEPIRTLDARLLLAQ